MENVRLSFGQVVWAKVTRDDGLGEKARPCIVLEDDGEFLRVLAGSSQLATPGSLVPGEFLVIKPNEMAEMQLTVPTRFSWKAGGEKTIQRVGMLLGITPNSVLGEAFRAAKLIDKK